LRGLLWAAHTSEEAREAVRKTLRLIELLREDGGVGFALVRAESFETSRALFQLSPFGFDLAADLLRFFTRVSEFDKNRIARFEVALVDQEIDQSELDHGAEKRRRIPELVIDFGEKHGGCFSLIIGIQVERVIRELLRGIEKTRRLARIKSRDRVGDRPFVECFADEAIGVEIFLRNSRIRINHLIELDGPAAFKERISRVRAGEKSRDVVLELLASFFCFQARRAELDELLIDGRGLLAIPGSAKSSGRDE
jgi:hypothetical protein